MCPCWMAGVQFLIVKGHKPMEKVPMPMNGRCYSFKWHWLVNRHRKTSLPLSAICLTCGNCHQKMLTVGIQYNWPVVSYLWISILSVSRYLAKQLQNWISQTSCFRQCLQLKCGFRYLVRCILYISWISWILIKVGIVSNTMPQPFRRSCAAPFSINQSTGLFVWQLKAGL